MGKGKLKIALKNQKITEAHEKGADLKKKKPAKPVLEDPESESESESDSSEELQDEIDALQSKDTPLSKKEKRQLKKLLAKAAEQAAQAEEEEESEEEELDLEKLAASESESELDDEEDEEDDDEEAEEAEDEEAEEKDEEEEEEEEEDDIPLSDVELDSDADVVPHSKLTINNTAALKEALARVRLPWEKHSFVEHQSILSAEKSESGIKDIYDDTERELAFYRQGLDAVKQGRATLLKLKVPISRPLDYFAEMVKSDEHMDKLKSKLLKEAADKRASEDAKKQRSLKKFGKKVQNETLQERAKQKRDTLEKIKSLKKRGANNFDNDAEFQIALEEATADERPAKRAKPNGKRMAKDSKYGFGGQKRGMRRNDADSAGDLYDQRGKKGGKGGKPTRPGKSKRRKN